MRLADTDVLVVPPLQALLQSAHPFQFRTVKSVHDLTNIRLPT